MLRPLVGTDDSETFERYDFFFTLSRISFDEYVASYKNAGFSVTRIDDAFVSNDLKYVLTESVHLGLILAMA